MTSTTPPPALLDAAERSVIERVLQHARIIAGAAVEESDGLLLVKIGAELPPINSAFVTRVPDDPADVVARARAFFARFGVGWSLKPVGEAVAEALAPVAEAAGLTPGETMPSMLLWPLVGEVPDLPGLTIERVADQAALRLFRQTSAGDEDSIAVYELLYPPAVLAAPGLALYLGFLDGRPVATSVRITAGEIAGIGGVSTLPEVRRRGIGAAMTWRAALDGRAQGCIASYLQSSAMGYHVYQQMGYRHVLDHVQWDAPAE
jgi:hypothetical protein